VVLVRVQRLSAAPCEKQGHPNMHKGICQGILQRQGTPVFSRNVVEVWVWTDTSRRSWAVLRTFPNTPRRL